MVQQCAYYIHGKRGNQFIVLKGVNAILELPIPKSFKYLPIFFLILEGEKWESV